MADWKEEVTKVAKRIFGSGGAAKAAEKINARPSRIEDEEEKALGGDKADKKAGMDAGEIGKKWSDSFGKD